MEREGGDFDVFFLFFFLFILCSSFMLINLMF